MKKIKKLFNLLPALCLAVLSGLSAVLFEDHKLKPTYADSSVLISNRVITDYHLNFNDSSTTGLVWDWVFDYDINFYYDQSQNNFYFVLNIVDKYPQWSFTYNGVTKYTGIEENRTETLVSSRMSLSSSTFNSPLNFYVGGIISDTNRFYYGELLGRWIWQTSYRINYYFAFPSSSGFTPANVTLASPHGDYYFLGFSWDSQPSGFNPNSSSPRKTSSTSSIVNYNVDYSKSNYDLGYSDGYSAGYNDGFNVGYDSGYNTGNDNGYQAGYEAGVASQQQEITDAYNDGFSAGYDEGFSADTTATTIFSGILQVGMLPVNVLLAMFNFEILGINLSAFVSAILTVCLTVIVIRNIKGGGD